MTFKWLSLMLILVSPFAQAHNLPFIGTREFWFIGYDNPRVIRYLTIDKKGNTKVLYDYNGIESTYQGKYKPIICGDNTSIKILNTKKIALVDKKGKILQECNSGNKSACISPLMKVNYHIKF